MTIETCKRMMDICIKNNDKEGAELYRKRIERKEKRFGIKPQIIVKEAVAKEPEEHGKKR